MIATRRGLAIVGGLAVVLAIALGLDLSRPPTIEDHALLGSFQPPGVLGMTWKRSGARDFSVVHQNGWQILPPDPPDPLHAFLPDLAALQDVLDTLHGARWHRRGPAMPHHATLTIGMRRGAYVIGIGEPLLGTEQVWLTVDGVGLLVDRWVARALDEAPQKLRVRVPLAAPDQFESIELAAELRVAPTPWRLTQPVPLLLAAEPAAALERALAEVSLVRISDTRLDPHGRTIRAHGAGASDVTTVTLGASCPDSPELVVIGGSYGDGCITAGAAAAVERAVAALSGDRSALIERRPAPFEPAQIKLADGATLDVVRGRIDSQLADAARVAELVAALSVPGTPVPRPAATASSSKIVITDRRGAAITLELLGGALVARAGEPLALQLAPGAIAVVTRPSHALRDLGLRLEEPTTISAITLDDVHYQRGATLGEWTRAPAGPVDPVALEALVAQLAAPHGLSELASPIPARHQLAITITPPVGGPVRHAITVGAPGAGGCPVQADDAVLLLPAALCAAVDHVGRDAHIRPK